jgi:hypothetical protein
MTEKTMDFNPDQARTTFIDTSVSKIRVAQGCMLCENTRELPCGYGGSHYPWVCNECKEAIAFVKELKHKQESLDTLKPILD